jgi:hypothetical protein
MVLVLLTVGFAVPLDVADVNDWLLLLMFSVHGCSLLAVHVDSCCS